MTGAPGADRRTLARRLRAQRLTGRDAISAAELVAALGAVQAQDPVAAGLALRARSRGLRLGDVDRARDEERSLVWTWALRGTLHLVAAQDVGWLLGLLGPVFAAAGRRRRLALGLDDELCERALVALRTIVSDSGPLTRAQLVERLAARGVVIDADGQAPAHLVALAALRGVVCRIGPAASPRYALLDDCLGAPPRRSEEDAALAELARRHVAAHGPATPADLAAWSGAGMRRARRGFELIAGELREVATTGGAAWVAATAPPLGRARPRPALLGHFDPYLLGWASRAAVLDARFARRIQAGGGFIAPALLVDGRVAGTWRRERRGDGLDVTLEPFAPLADDVLAALAREAADVARFLGVRPDAVRTSVRS